MPTDDMRDVMLAQMDAAEQQTAESRVERIRREREARRTAEEAAQGQETTQASAQPSQPQTAPSDSQNAPRGASVVGTALSAAGGALDAAGGIAGPAADYAWRATYEQPGAIVNGLVGAVNSTLDSIDMASRWLESVGVPDPRITYLDPETGGFRLGVTMDPREFEQRLRDNGIIGQDEQAGNLPDISEPFPERTTFPSQATEAISQFLFGFAGAGKITESAGLFRSWDNLRRLTAALRGGGTEFNIAKATVNGFIANFTVFDGQEQNLSNMIQEVPALRNPVTEFLAVGPDDTEAEGRLKFALEGLGLGLATDGIIAGVRSIAAVRRMRREANTVASRLDQVDEDAAREIEQNVFRNGRPDEPTVATTEPRGGTMGQQLDLIEQADAAAGRAGLTAAETERVVSGVSVPGYTLSDGREIRLNLNSIDSEEDITAGMSQLADIFSSDLEAPRRGIRGNETVITDAETLRGWDVLNERRTGEVLNDSQVYAAQSFYAASGENIRDAIAHAIDNPDSTTAQFALRRALMMHRAIQAQIVGARAEAGRALRAWGITARAGAGMRQEMDTMLEMHGGKFTPENLAHLREIAGSNSEALDMATRQFANAREATSETLGAIIRFAWLMGTGTHARNIAGNTVSTTVIPLSRVATGAAGRLIGDPEMGRLLGEGLIEYAGIRAGLAAQFRHFARTGFGQMAESVRQAQKAPTLRGRIMGTAASIRDIRTPMFSDMGVSGGKYGGQRGRVVASENYGSNGIDRSNPISNAWANIVDAGGILFHTPNALLGYADDFFKGVNEHRDRYRLAYRTALDELGLDAPQQSVATRMTELITDPTPEIIEQSRRSAQRATFTEPTGQGTRRVLGARRWLNGLGVPFGHIIFPFISTPSNLMRFSFMNSPAGYLFKEIQDDIAAGGARAATAHARVAGGTALLFLATDLAASGMLTGQPPSDPGMRQLYSRMEIPPESFRVGDQWHSYRGLEPVSTMFGIGADLHWMMSNMSDADMENVDMLDVLGPALAASLATVSNKTYFTSAAQMVEVMNDPERYAPSFLRNLAASIIVPAGIRQWEKAVDPVYREAHSIGQLTMSRLPYLSDNLPVQYDLWGRPREPQFGAGQAYDAFAPFAIRTFNPEPIDLEMARLGVYTRMPSYTFSMPDSNGLRQDINLRAHPEIYSRFVQLAGNGIEVDYGMTLLQYMNALVEGEIPESRLYRNAPEDPTQPHNKGEIINTAILRARGLAATEIRREFEPQLRRLADEARVRGLSGPESSRTLLTTPRDRSGVTIDE